MFKHQSAPFARRGADGLAQIGPTRFDIAGIRFFNDTEGADGAGTPGSQPETPPAPPAPQAPPAPTPQPPAQQPAPVQYKGNPDDYVRELREEAKSHRLAADQARTAAEKAAEEAKAAQAERDAIAAERDALAREKALLLNAPKLGARPDLLLDSSSFMKTFADVDLADEAAVEAAIKNAVEKNSAFRATTLPAMSGGGHQGGGTPNAPVTLDGAVKAALSQTP